MNKERVTCVLAIAALVLCAFFARESLLLPPPMMEKAPSPSLFPLIGLIAAAVFAMIMGVQSFLAMKTRTETVCFYAREGLPHILLLGAYIVALPLLGYIAASIVYLVVALFKTTRAWKKSVAVAVGFTAVLYALFETFLGVSLPAGIIVWGT